MQLETNNFPSDPDNSQGHLARELCKALHRASEHPDHADILEQFLKFSSKQLKVARDDYKVRAKIRAEKAEKLRLAEEAAEVLRLEGLYGKNEEVIVELTEENQSIAKVLGKESTDGEESKS